MRDVRDALLIARNTDGKMVRRPLSPHLQVYRPQITSMGSIANRISGVALGAGTLLLTWWLLAAATSADAWNTVRGFTVSPIGLLMLFGWTLALAYHTLGGLRHLAWDAGWGFDLKTTHATGWAAIAGALVLTCVIWALGFLAW